MATPHSLVKKINYLQVLHRLCIQQGIYNSGLHFGQPPILEYIAAHEDCTQREISASLHISPPSVATSVKRLQRAGFLEKLSDENDLRRSRLRLTQLGRDAGKTCEATFHAIDEKLFQGFSSEEIDTFSGFLDRLIDNLAEGDLKGETMFSLLEKSKGMHVHVIRDRRDRHD